MAEPGTDAAPGGKSAAAFRTISEVSQEIDVPQHVLRFWETRFAQIRPMKRRGGRRYYRPEDIDLLRRIRDWLYSEGYTIKGVQKLLRGRAGSRQDQEAAAAGSAEAAVPRTGPGLSPDQFRTLSALLRELTDLRNMLRQGPR